MLVKPPVHLAHGIQTHLSPFLHQSLQMFLVGLTLGMMRTPALAELEFGSHSTSFVWLAACTDQATPNTSPGPGYRPAAA